MRERAHCLHLRMDLEVSLKPEEQAWKGEQGLFKQADYADHDDVIVSAGVLLSCFWETQSNWDSHKRASLTNQPHTQISCVPFVLQECWLMCLLWFLWLKSEVFECFTFLSLQMIEYINIVSYFSFQVCFQLSASDRMFQGPFSSISKYRFPPFFQSVPAESGLVDKSIFLCFRWSSLR